MKLLNSAKLAVLGTVGLSAIGLLGMPQSAKAADTCGPGADWVKNCKAGVDVFPKSWAFIDLWLLNPVA